MTADEPGPRARSAAPGSAWQLRGACRQTDSAVFFEAEGERAGARAARAATAKAICRECPVLEPCRRYALEAEEPYGIWGGLTPVERDSVRSYAIPSQPSRRAPQEAAETPRNRHLRLA
jgi:WhiB family redox-sensing transcriptional regulator